MFGLGSFVLGRFSAQHTIAVHTDDSKFFFAPIRFPIVADIFASRSAPSLGCSQLGRIGAQTHGLSCVVLGRFSAQHDITVHTDYLKRSSALIHF